MSSRSIVLYAAIISVFMFPFCAFAQECKREGTRVSCSEFGFRVLTTKLAELQGAERECMVKLDSLDDTVVEQKTALDTCLAIVPPPCPPPPPVQHAPKLPPAIGYALGVVGTFVATAFLLSDASTSTKAVAGAVGVASVVTGVFLTIPLD